MTAVGQGMRAHVFGGLRLTDDGRERDVPTGKLADLLRWWLLRPNQVQRPEQLVQLLWPADAKQHEDVLRSRLHVVVSRLRNFLGGGSGVADGGRRGLWLESVPGGYRLVADADALDRVAFESLAERALAGDLGAVHAALAVWTGDPYQGFPVTAEMQRVRSHLVGLRRDLERLRDANWPSGREAPLPGDGLARTKFIRPKVASRPLLARPRLLERAGSVGDISFLVVTAPAGFGKSVFLSQWAEAQSVPVAWINVEDEDNDPVRFWSALDQAFTWVDGLDIGPVPTDATPGSPRFARAWVEHLASAGTAVGVVIDDVHRLVNRELQQQIRAALAWDADWLTVAASSRSELPVTLDELADAGGSRLLSARDLRFEADEVAEVLAVGGTAAEGGHDIASVTDVAEGWPIAVSYLSRLRTAVTVEVDPSSEPQDRPSQVSDRFVDAMDAYLLDEVLDEVPESIRSFLLVTAHLDELNHELCDAVTGVGGSEGYLTWLHEREMFVEEACGTGWFRYHHLVAEVLRRRAEADPDIDTVDLHRRAGRWYRVSGVPEVALGHAIRGGDDATVATVAGYVLRSAARRSEVHTGVAWLRSISPDVLAADRAAHDLATLLASSWLGPESAAGWVASRRRHYHDHDDLFARIHEAGQHHRQGRPRAALAVTTDAMTLSGPYFDRYPSLSGIPDRVDTVLRIMSLEHRILAGQLHHDAPELEHTVEIARDQGQAMLAGALSGWVFLAYVEGDQQRVTAMLGDLASPLASMDETSSYLAAQKALVTKALVDSDRSPEPVEQRRILRRLAPMVDLYEELRWDVDLILLRLALHVISRRAGDHTASVAHLAQADLLLTLCEDVPLLWTARERLAVGVPPNGRSGVVAAPLTDREQVVLDQLDSGLTYQQIAEELQVSVHTVSSQVGSIYRKLGVSTRHGAVRRQRSGR